MVGKNKNNSMAVVEFIGNAYKASDLTQFQKQYKLAEQPVAVVQVRRTRAGHAQRHTPAHMQSRAPTQSPPPSPGTERRVGGQRGVAGHPVHHGRGAERALVCKLRDMCDMHTRDIPTALTHASLLYPRPHRWFISIPKASSTPFLDWAIGQNGGVWRGAGVRVMNTHEYTQRQTNTQCQYHTVIASAGAANTALVHSISWGTVRSHAAYAACYDDCCT